MKKKLEDLKLARKAWLDAKTAKKAKEELDPLYKTVLAAQLAVDEGEAAGEKAEDDADKGSKEGAVVTLEEIQDLLSKTVAEQIKSAIPEALKGQVTEEGLKGIIAAEFEKHQKANGKKAADPISAADVKAFTETVVKEQFAALQKGGSRMQHDTDGDNHEKTMIKVEMPISWCKGNLPLHAKQLLNIMMKRNPNDGVPDSVLKKGLELGDRMVTKYVSAAKAGKAMTSTGAGTGDEWVPTDLSSELQRRFYLSSDIAAYFAAREIDMPSQPFEYPLLTTRPTFLLETTENTAATASDPGTGKLVLDAKKIMGRTDFSYEVEEDAIVPILQVVQQQLGEAAGDAYEDALINGDTTATHQDSDTQLVAKHAARAFKGFRVLALAVSSLKVDLSTGGINEANLRSLKKKLKKYGVRLRDLIWITGPLGINDMQGITNVSTLEKYGPRATILTGELASFLGIPILVSERCREDLNASGVFDNTTTTKGSILLVNSGHFIPGRRREFTVEVFRDIKTQTHVLVASYRRAFIPIETPSASISALAIGYNYAA